jgi:hypothetical protein
MKKRGKEKGIHLHLSNRLSYTLIAIFILAVVGIGVYALTPGIVPNPGHDISTVSPPSPCAASQYLQFNGDKWKCATPSQVPLTGGMYGYCQDSFSGTCISKGAAYGGPIFPAVCGGCSRGPDNCCCASGYSLRWTGNDGSGPNGGQFFSCTKD